MKQKLAWMLLRFVFGFGVAAITCALAMKREVWREQLPILLAGAGVVGAVCALWPAFARGIPQHWTF
jgi:hypothetical protein